MTIVELDLLVKSVGLYGTDIMGGYLARPEKETFYTIRVQDDILTFYNCISYIKKTNSIRHSKTRFYTVMMKDANPKEIAKDLVEYMTRYNLLKKKQANELELIAIANEFKD